MLTSEDPKARFQRMVGFIAITEQLGPRPHFCSLDFHSPWPFPE